MKLSVKLTAFKMAVNTVCKAISNRTTLPILEYLYFEIKGDQILLRGNDLELGIEYHLPTTIIDSSTRTSVLIKAHTLNDILSKLDAEDITIALGDNGKVNVKALTIDFDILGLPSTEYPQFPSIEKDIQVNMNTSLLTDFIKHTLFSVSTDETKQFLNGIKIESKDNRCDFISTDGFRLSLKYAQFETEIPEFSCIVPYKTMQELLKILTTVKSDQISITMSERQITFHLGDSIVLSRLINGRFPDYKQVLPKTTTFQYQLSRQLLLHATERANIIASHSNFVAKFEFSSEHLTISASNSKLGDYVEQLPVNQIIGETGINVSFNIKLLQEALKIIEQQDVMFEMTSELSPCVIKPVGDTTYTHILMPIRMSEYSSDTNEFKHTDSATKKPEPAVI